MEQKNKSGLTTLDIIFALFIELYIEEEQDYLQPAGPLHFQMPALLPILSRKSGMLASINFVC